jgi:hypothetical protein
MAKSLDVITLGYIAIFVASQNKKSAESGGRIDLSYPDAFSGKEKLESIPVKCLTLFQNSGTCIFYPGHGKTAMGIA